MSLLPISLFEYRLLPERVQMPRDILREIFLSLPVADLERLHLGCHAWLHLINNAASDLIRQQWPHLFAQYNHPRRNWIPIYCIKLRAIENIAAGCFQVSRLQFDSHTLGYGMDLGKLVFRDPDGDTGILSLAGGGIYKVWDTDNCYQTCLGRLFGDCQQGWQLWNMQTGQNLLNLKGKTRVQLTRYENAIIIVDKNSENNHLFFYDDIRQQLRELLPPSGFNCLNMSVSLYPRGQQSNFFSGQISLIWSVSEKDIIKDQVVAVYQLCRESKDLHPESTHRLPISFNHMHLIRSVHLHEGYTLVWIDPELQNQEMGWLIFDQKNKRLNFPDTILHAVWMTGKIIMASSHGDDKRLYILDTTTKTLQFVRAAFLLNYRKDGLTWMHAIDKKHVVFLGKRDGIVEVELFVLNVITLVYSSFKIPKSCEGEFDLLVPPNFDGEKLILTTFSGDSSALCVMDFTVRHPSDPRVEKVVKAANCKTALRPRAGEPYRWEPYTVALTRGSYKYWWLTATIVILGFLYFSRQQGHKEG